MVTCIDEVHVGGDGRSEIRREKDGDVPDVFCGNVSTQRRDLRNDVEDARKTADLARAGRLDGPCRDRVDANIAIAQVKRDIADRRLECSLGDAHQVIVWHDLGRTEIGQRHDRGAVQK